MARSSVSIALFYLVSILSRTASGFTISLAPLLTARLGLGRFGSNYVSNFSSPVSVDSSAALPGTRDASKPAVERLRFDASKPVELTKPPVQQFKFESFEYDDIRMLSGCKSECLELIYARSMDRGFSSA
mmetsp:Transcript_48174/g.102475  ORF Transcript_48174/g.102475 Transcript_48174/m.102475 type:complete len:130 (-) Transcript_48174:275-664(-)